MLNIDPAKLFVMRIQVDINRADIRLEWDITSKIMSSSIVNEQLEETCDIFPTFVSLLKASCYGH